MERGATMDVPVVGVPARYLDLVQALMLGQVIGTAPLGIVAPITLPIAPVASSVAHLRMNHQVASMVTCLAPEVLGLAGAVVAIALDGNLVIGFVLGKFLHFIYIKRLKILAFSHITWSQNLD